MQSLGVHKRGDTFYRYMQISDSEGNPITSIADRFRCQIRDEYGDLVSNVSIKETNLPGQYLIYVEDTTKWPSGKHYLDFELKLPLDDLERDMTISSETLSITVEKDVTHDECAL